MMRSFPVSCAALLATALSLPAGAALAQAYPAKPVHVVVPFATGGAVDVVARVVGQKLSEQMGQSIVVDNRPGASANIGAEVVAKAAPDGYTLLMAANGLATNNTLFPNLPFNGIRDFLAVARIGYAPLVIVVTPNFPAKSLKELVALAQAQPGKLTYGSAGNGTSGHLAGEQLKIAAKIDVLHVPYKGGAPAIVDLLGDRLSFMPINPIEVTSYIKGGRLRVLAVGSDRRVPSLPEVPTVSEAGVPGYEATVWWGLVAPAKTPRDIVVRLNGETNKALGDAVVREKLTELGAVITPGTPEQFADFIRAEDARWAAVIRTSGIKPD
jgi:tripartite-type tricarboxylate transporter receptor subunit TctC